MNPSYGKVGERQVIDASGSTVEVESNFIGGEVVYPMRRKFEIRHKLEKKNTEKMAEILSELLQDPRKLDKSLRLDTGKDKDGEMFHLVECYTVLVY